MKYRYPVSVVLLITLGLGGPVPVLAAEPPAMTPEVSDAVIAKADKMVENQQFASAFNYLRTEADKNGRPPALLIRMAVLAISSYITQPGDELYGLADLKRETLEEARSRTTSYKITVAMPRALLEEAAAKDPRSAEPYLTLGWYHSVRWVDSMDDEGNGDPQEAGRAEKAYRKTVELDPSNWWAHFRLGAFLAALGKDVEAEKALLASISLQPRFPESYYNLGVISMEREDYPKALDYGLRAISLYTGEETESLSDAYMLVADAFGSLDQDDRAVEYFEEGLALAPQNLRGWYFYAVFARDNLGMGTAEEILTLMLENNQDEGYSPYQTLLAFLDQSRNYQFGEDVLRGLQKKVTQAESRGWIALSLGTVYYREQKYSQGIRSFQEALVYLKKAYPEDTELHDYIRQMINEGIGKKW